MAQLLRHTLVSAEAGMLCCVAASRSPFGRLVLVSGPEALFADRAVEALRQQMRSEAPDVEVSEIEAARLDSGKLAEITSPSLFSSQRAAVITELENLAPELDVDLVNLAAAQLPDLAVITVHRGVPKGRGLLEKLKSAGVEVIECAAVKPWELPQFVSAEVKRAGSSIDAGCGVGAGGRRRPRPAGSGGGGRTAALGWGGWSDHRRSGPPLLRWSVRGDQLCRGRRRVGGAHRRCDGAAPLGARDRCGPGADHQRPGVRRPRSWQVDHGRQRAARSRPGSEVGVPPWKLKSMRSQARGWDQGGLATALKAIAVADADVKGAADDAAYALERAVLGVSLACRRS